MTAAVERRNQIAANLVGVEDRLAKACHAAQRPRSDVVLIAVTKTFPASDIRILADLGVRDIGENRDREARSKVDEVSDLDLAWHFVGQLQTNKCRSVAGYADVVHSVDRAPLVAALADAVRASGREVAAFVQVSLDDAPGRGGARPEDVPALAARVAESDGLRLAGVMAVAPLGGDPAVAFDRLARVSAIVRTAHPDARGISAGMSGDLEAAVAAGATHVRIGTALLGGRPRLVR